MIKRRSAIPETDQPETEISVLCGGGSGEVVITMVLIAVISEFDRRFKNNCTVYI